MKFKFFIFLLLLCAQFIKAQNEREIWVNSLIKIVDPVLFNFSNGTLRASMPIETTEEGRKRNRADVSHLEALGRTVCGISPWLELGANESKEGKLRSKYIEMTLNALKNAMDSTSSDFLLFNGDRQALVDAAFLAQGLMRAPNQIWSKLDNKTQQMLLKSLKSTRIFKPLESNWLLFSAMIEAFMYKHKEDCNFEVIDYALDRFDEWYKGDGWYGDGALFHFDYYNSLVIHPMMYDILNVIKNKSPFYQEKFKQEEMRLKRFAALQERMISPEGTYPVIGRSLPYRFGTFHALSQVALLNKLPSEVSPAQVRCCLTQVIKRQIKQKGTFDKKGWLTLGFCGHQPEIAESYLSTGSLYLCSVVFLPLGLSPEDEFWSLPSKEWTSKKAWSGKPIKIDKALKR